MKHRKKGIGSADGREGKKGKGQREESGIERPRCNGFATPSRSARHPRTARVSPRVSLAALSGGRIFGGRHRCTEAPQTRISSSIPW